ncbi:MAG: hypothetical protein K9I95_06975 [Flavobacteriaceae bacterium]|nr:hypothetical protein [Flavobacteriaceae bacterium]
MSTLFADDLQYRKKNAKGINGDLWGQLLNIFAEHQVNFNWVKEHDGHKENERCDPSELALCS